MWNSKGVCVDGVVIEISQIEVFMERKRTSFKGESAMNDAWVRFSVFVRSARRKSWRQVLTCSCNTTCNVDE